MKIRKMLAGAGTALILSSTGLVMSATPASATPCEGNVLVGSGGHQGAWGKCGYAGDPGTFSIWVKCRVIPSGYEYKHDGASVPYGSTAYAWCALGDSIVSTGFYA